MNKKFIVLVGDGMADYPLAELGDKTPLEAARTPNMDLIAKEGRLGRIRTIPEKMTPASDVANISILGYDPKTYYTGRGPLEAANIGVELCPDDVVFRCNLITVSQETLLDYSAGHISSKEAKIIINFIDKELGNEKIKFYPGVSYRHLLVVKGARSEGLQDLKCNAPHDVSGQPVGKNLPKGPGAEFIVKLMLDSYPLLEKHEINQVRVDLKENPANMIWLWGQGIKPDMPLFKEKYGVSGSVISAVDLIKGLGKILGLNVINVKGATGFYDTDYKAKARAAIRSLKDNDFVFVHVEAPDEAGHNGDLAEKIRAIERIDKFVLGTILRAFENEKKFRILVLPDHATPLSLKTHTADEVLFGIYGDGILGRGFNKYCEKEAKNSELYFERGHELMEYFINKVE